ncbi:MAG: hypothetical protein ACYC2K_10205 [Gemmatimonadales bacterium]
MTAMIRNERGVALILTLLITMAVAAMAIGGVMIAGASGLTSRFAAREAALHSLADAGLEIARDEINRVSTAFPDSTILPDTGYIVIAPAASIYDASGNVISGYTRTVYAGRTGGRTGGPATSGQYGSNYMSVLSVIHDPRGAVAARRGLFAQESWSKFAVAVNNWSSSIPYGCGSSITGPLHSNDDLRIQSGCTSPRTLFAGEVTVVGSIINPSSGNFTRGYETGATPLPWPTPAQLGTMQRFAEEADVPGGDYDLTGGNIGTNRPCTRLDFQVLDSNQDGIIQWDEGYVRIFKCNNLNYTSLAYVNARRWNQTLSGFDADEDPNMLSPNCGAYVTNASGAFRSAQWIYNNTSGTAYNKRTRVQNVLSGSGGTGYVNKRCYLGGDPRLFRSVTGDTLLPDSTTANTEVGSNNGGRWIRRRLGAHASVTTVRSTIASGGDAEYWIPLGKNPDFKGVIYVTGDVAISGRLRGRVTVVSTGIINLQDDFTYWTPPGTNCSETGDIFGALAVQGIITQDNNLQTPFKVDDVFRGGFDDTPADENYHMFLLSLTNFGSDMESNGTPGYDGPTGSPAIPSSAGETCGGARAGCIRISGGIAYARMDWAGFRTYGSGSSSTGYGWASGHTYDQCGASNPPPYFPTTGRYLKNRYYEIDPVWLNQIGIGTYLNELQSR